MTISFDLDNLLIPGVKQFATEKQNRLQRVARLERIRLGTKQLFKELRRRGHSIFIYTTSFRSLIVTELTFYSYGIPVDRVINQEIHNKRLKENRTKASKYPPEFGIDIHVDDSPGIKVEGERFKFRTIIIDEHDSDWGQTVLSKL